MAKGKNVFDEEPDKPLNNDTAHKLLGYVQRLEQLDAEAAEISERKKDIRTEIKSAGFDTAMVNRVLSIRKLEKDKRELLHTYAVNLGVFD